MADDLDRNATIPSVETRSDGVRIDGVDFGQRIITVLAVPYEQPTQVVYRQELYDEVFSRSAFNGIEGQTRKIPATAALEIPAAEHKGARVVGRVVSSDPYGEAGLISEIKISRTSVGDDTLELAADEALWPSIGFLVKNPRFDQEIDRHSKTRRVNRAFLDHLAFVGQPAYEGAKILAMRSAAEAAVLESEAEPFSSTPLMDQFMNDPIMQWATKRAAERWTPGS